MGNTLLDLRVGLSPLHHALPFGPAGRQKSRVEPAPDERLSRANNVPIVQLAS